MAVDPIEGSRAGRDTRSELLAALLCALAIVGPIRSAHELSRDVYGPFAATASLHVSDFPLALLLVVVAPAVLVAARRSRATTALAVLVAWLLVSLLVHPSAPGVLHVLRLFGAVAVALALVEVGRTARAATVVRCLLVSTAFQAVLALAQVLNDGPLGLTALGERQELTYFGGQAAGQGTLNHPYILVGWTLVAAAVVIAFRRRDPSTSALDDVATVVTGVAVGVSFSRAAAVGVVVAAPLLVLAVRGHPGARRAAMLLAGGAVAAGLVFNGGWVNRVRSTTSAASSRSLEAASTDRGVLLRDAMEIAKDNPAVGVGPSRYLAGLKELGDVEDDDFKPVHDVPALVTAEGGIPGGLLVVVLLVTLVYVAARAGPMALAAGALYAPFVLLDHFPYYSVQGTLATGLWVGLIDHLRDRDR